MSLKQRPDARGYAGVFDEVGIPLRTRGQLAARINARGTVEVCHERHDRYVVC